MTETVSTNSRTQSRIPAGRRGRCGRPIPYDSELGRFVREEMRASSRFSVQEHPGGVRVLDTWTDRFMDTDQIRAHRTRLELDRGDWSPHVRTCSNMRIKKSRLDSVSADLSGMIRAPKDASGIPRCPRCGGPVPNESHPGEYPGAVSRTDNRTEVCSRCGGEEALAGIERPMEDMPPLGELDSAIEGKGVEGLAFDEDGFVQLGWEEWERRFRPIRDEHGSIRDFWGVEGVEECAERDPLCLWTEVQVEGGFAIYNGKWLSLIHI